MDRRYMHNYCEFLKVAFGPVRDLGRRIYNIEIDSCFPGTKFCQKTIKINRL